MAKHSTIVTITNGLIENKQSVRELFNELKDGRYLVEVNTANKRTNPQNRYYHGLVVPMVQKGIEDLGTEISIAETHEFLKARFNSIEVVNKETGEVVAIPKSTSKLTTVQFNEYKEKIQRFASEFLGIYIPDPNEQLELAY